jgi:hypothetical protein
LRSPEPSGTFGPVLDTPRHRARRPGAGRRSCLAGLGLLALACESPPGLPPPPDSRLPPLESAAECDPAPRFAQRWFWLTDLSRARSCPVFLEQDECVLAIYRDCTGDDGRQWEGTIDGSRDVVRLRPLVASPGPEAVPQVCSGALADRSAPGAWALLECQGAVGHLGLHLEGVTDAPPVLGAGSTGPVRATNLSYSVFDILPALVEVRTSSGTELWALEVDRVGGGEASGVVVLDPERLTPRARIPVPGAELMTALPDGSGAVLASPHALFRLSAADRRPLQVEGEPDWKHGALVARGEHVYIGLISDFDPNAWRLERRLAADLAPAGRLDPLPARPELIVQTGGTGPDDGALVIGGVPPGEERGGRVVAVSPGLELLWRRDLGGTIRGLVSVDGARRVAVTRSGASTITELDVADGAMARPIPFPYFGPHHLAYDRSLDRLLVAGGERLGVVDRSARLPVQSFRVLEQSSTGLVLRPDARRLLVLYGRDGFVESVELD